MQSIGGRRLLAVTGSALAAAALLAVAGWMLLGGGKGVGSPSADDGAIQIIAPGEALPGSGAAAGRSAGGASAPGAAFPGSSAAGASSGQYPGAAAVAGAGFPGASSGQYPGAAAVAGAGLPGASSGQYPGAAAGFPGASSGQQAGAASDLAYAPGEIAVYITGAVARPGVYRVAFGARLDAVIARAGGASQDADLSRINLAAYVSDAAHYRIPTVGAPADGAFGIPSAGVAGGGDATGAMAAANIHAGSGAVNGSAVGAGGVSAGEFSANAAGAGVVSAGEVSINGAGAGIVSTGGGNINGAGAGGVAAAVCAAPIDINSATPDCLETLPGIGRVRAETIVAHREEAGPFPSVESITAVSGIGNGIYGRIAGLITARPR